MTLDVYYVAVTACEHVELLNETLAEDIPGPREVTGRTLATLISTGTELAASYTAQTNYPIRPGYAAVFEVRAVGEEVTDMKPGDHAFCMGTHASYQRHSREHVLPVSAGLSPEVAVLARMMGISMSALTITTARPPAKVLVTGLGIVGNLAAQIFASCGYDVTGCDPQESRRQAAMNVSLQKVLPAVPLDDPDVCGQVDLVLECSGHEQAVLDGAKTVRKNGEVILIGVPWKQQTQISAFRLLEVVFHNYVVLRSGWEWQLPRHQSEFRTNSIFGNFAAALDWLAEGRVKAGGLCEKCSPREAQEAYQRLLQKRCERLSIVFDWTDLA